jgi:hypothetical protein
LSSKIAIFSSIFDRNIAIFSCSSNEGIFILILDISFLLISRNVDPEDLLIKSF